jgi:hypothetical protein
VRLPRKSRVWLVEQATRTNTTASLEGGQQRAKFALAQPHGPKPLGQSLVLRMAEQKVDHPADDSTNEYPYFVQCFVNVRLSRGQNSEKDCPKQHPLVLAEGYVIVV